MNLYTLSFAHSWELYGENLEIEFRQCLEEGKDVASLEEQVKAVCAMPRSVEKEAMADALFALLEKAPVRKNYPYEEPSDYASILAARPAVRPVLPPLPEKELLREKLSGAWYGRICGCLLGKPVEGMRTPDLIALLKADDNYPLRKYIGSDPQKLRERGISEGSIQRLAGCYRPGFMPADDDTNYTVMAAQKLIPQYGRNFTPRDVASTWISSQPMTAYCTAERVAYKNFVNAIIPPMSAIYKNPFREWIGAQIRADYFGYINPGHPEAAAAMAWRDASISHIKNGIYGEMLMAAAIAAAAVLDSPRDILLAGLAEIPEKSRLSEDVRKIIALYDAHTPQEEVFRSIHSQWDEFSAHDWCHTNSNAMICAAALLYGGLDYGKSITMAVETGFDTDCNGATVGSLVGMVIGEKALGEEWTSAINGKVDTQIIGCGMFSVKELVEQTFRHMA